MKWGRVRGRGRGKDDLGLPYGYEVSFSSLDNFSSDGYSWVNVFMINGCIRLNTKPFLCLFLLLSPGSFGPFFLCTGFPRSFLPAVPGSFGSYCLVIRDVGVEGR